MGDVVAKCVEGRLIGDDRYVVGGVYSLTPDRLERYASYFVAQPNPAEAEALTPDSASAGARPRPRGLPTRGGDIVELDGTVIQAAAIA